MCCRHTLLFLAITNNFVFQHPVQLHTSKQFFLVALMWNVPYFLHFKATPFAWSLKLFQKCAHLILILAQQLGHVLYLSEKDNCGSHQVFVK